MEKNCFKTFYHSYKVHTMLLMCVVFLLFDISLCQDHQKCYKGAQLWEVRGNLKEMLDINELSSDDDISIWKIHPGKADILIEPEMIEKMDRYFKNNNITYRITIDDMEKIIQEANPIGFYTTSDNLNWEGYSDLEEIYNFMENLESTYPKLCRVLTIGETKKGRSIKAIKVSNKNSGNRAILIEGGIHAREWISISTVTYIINDIVRNFNNQPSSVQNIDWYFIPVLNPDGYEYSRYGDRLWRKNRAKYGKCYGVDLNRNFHLAWGSGGSSSNPCSETFRGPKPFSEAETKAVRDMFLNIRADWWGYITFHSYGQYILMPYGAYSKLPENYRELKQNGDRMANAIRKLDGSKYVVGTSRKLLYMTSGGSDDWMKDVANVKFTYTIELLDTGRYGFVLPPRYIKKGARHGLTAVKVLANTIYNY